jgi:integrase
MATVTTKHEARGIYKRGAVYWLNVRRHGKRHFVSLETSDYAEAIRRAVEVRAAPTLQAGAGFPTEIENFLDYKRRRNEFTVSSAHGRGFILRAFAKWVDKLSAAFVTDADIAAYYDLHLHEHSATTANTYLSILHSFFQWAVNVAKICRRNPCLSIDRAEDEHSGITLRDFCREEQRDKLIKTVTRDDLKFALYCGFHAGMRKNEIIEARPFWFDMKARLIHLRRTATMNFKDREERTVPMTEEFHRFLLDYGLREPFMLQPNVKHGKNRYRYDFKRPFTEHMKAQGMEWMTIHTMRHTFASLLASNGVSLYKIAVWLGDDPRVVDRRYARLKPNDPDIERAFSGRTPARAKIIDFKK